MHLDLLDRPFASYNLMSKSWEPSWGIYTFTKLISYKVLRIMYDTP
jgi:hypothetical protein